MFPVAPAIAVAASVAGFVVANHEDYPPAQMSVAFLSLAVVLAWIVRRVRNALARGGIVSPPAA
jgi:hypothetical protein